MIRVIKRYIRPTCYVVIGLVLILVIATQAVKIGTASRRYDTQSGQFGSIPHRHAALVFGAGVLPDGTPTEYLKQRVQTAVDLYNAGKVDVLLVSGDNSSDHYDEPTVMRSYAMSRGVPSGSIIVDYAGFNTYDSCYRARVIMDITSVTAVTQGYHLPRAVMTCRALGLDAIGVAAQRDERDWTAAYLVREHISTLKALFQVIIKPHPTVL